MKYSPIKNCCLVDNVFWQLFVDPRIILFIIKGVYPTILENLTYKSLTYLGNKSLKLVSYLHKIDIDMAFRTSIKLGKYIKNNN